MKTNSILIISIAVGIFFLGTISCTSEKDKTTTEKQNVNKSVPVKTAIVNRQSVAKTIDYTASLIPFKEVYLAPATPGKIKKLM